MSKKGPVYNVRDILSVLTADEKVTALEHLSAFDKKSESNKRRKLFELLLTKDLVTDEDVRLQLSPTMSPAAFERLVYRVGERIEESLILDVSVNRDNAYPERSKVTIAVRKGITLAQIYQTRDKRPKAARRFKRIISICRKYELYEELLLALRYLIKQVALDEGDKELNNLLAEYKKFDFAKNIALNAEVTYSRVIADAEFRTELINDEVKLKQMVNQLNDDYEITKSAIVGYCYLQIKAQYHQIQRDFNSARTALLTLKRLFEKSPSINIPEKVGGVLLNLADNDLYLSRFHRSYESAEIAIDYLRRCNFNIGQAVEVLFYAKYYAGEFQIAVNIIFQMLPEVKSDDFRTGKRNYLLANSYFMLQDYATCLRYLNIINPIDTDKIGWNIGIRLMHIMTLIEMAEYDEATTKIDALRKFFDNGVVNHRAQLICQVLLGLTYNGYDFKNCYQKERSTLEMLDEKAGALSWKIKSPELVIFHQWFFAKTFRQPFKLNIPSHQIDIPDALKINQQTQ